MGQIFCIPGSGRNVASYLLSCARFVSVRLPSQMGAITPWMTEVIRSILQCFCAFVELCGEAGLADAGLPEMRRILKRAHYETHVSLQERGKFGIFALEGCLKTCKLRC